MSEQSCPVCMRVSDHFELCQVGGYLIEGCRSCGAEYVSPMPSRTELKAYYDRAQWFEGGERGGYQNYEEQTVWSVEALKSYLEGYDGGSGMSILDVGCGYGAHLELAANLGWKCFGVELSSHAREMAQKRLGGRAYLVESVDDLIPHEFDVILMLDVVEHLPEPYSLFYSLFAIGAITAKTRVIITTPNAGSTEAQQNPATWAYRHPPSHLVYYRPETVRWLLKKFRFDSVDVQGAHPLCTDKLEGLTLADYGGLWIQAQGSDFTEFMRERYVPGTWSKIAEYEHFPRYALASKLAENKKLLDFGCGTGYGSAILAKKAASVVGLDIDSSAITWAQETHGNSRLNFHRCDDLGAGLESGSFDLVTCFEMIEHVDHPTQIATISSIARLLRSDGQLIISTPNPEVTKLYGENPYHIREMTEVEFIQLLSAEFPFVKIFRQVVRNSIAFLLNDSQVAELASIHDGESQGVKPLAYVAICSRQPIAVMSNFVLFDDNTDLIGEFLTSVLKLNQERLSAYSWQEQAYRFEYSLAESVARGQEIGRLNEVVQAKDAALGVQGQEIARLNEVVQAKDAALGVQGQEIARLNEILQARDAEIASQIAEMNYLNSRRWTRMGRFLCLIGKR